MKKIDLSSLLRPSVKDLVPYAVEQVEHRIKMDANENPFPWPPGVLQAVVERMGQMEFNRYPDPSAGDLRQLLAHRLKVQASQIMLGNGSDELIQYILLAFGGPEVKVLSPIPTFAIYEIISRATGCRFVGVPLGPDLDLDEAATREAIREGRPGILILAYPNNPTGNCFRQESIEALLEEFEGIIVIDEAYFDFSRRTFLSHLGKQENLLILRTLSKIGLAGLRVGILLGSEGAIQAIAKVRLPYNLNSFSQVAALVVLSREKFIDSQIETLIAERERLFGGLQGLDGIQPFPSEANFILFKCQNARRVFEGLLSQGILVRSFGPSGLVKDCLRATVGRPEENDLFLEAMEEICQKGDAR